MKELIVKSLGSGLSQRDLARRIGVSHGTINNIVDGHIPNKGNVLQLIAEYYKVSIDELLPRRNPLHGIPSHSATTERVTDTRLDALDQRLGQIEAFIQRMVEAERANGAKAVRLKGGRIRLSNA
ncbi:MAG: helix-turn-helix transcriptional regulator [Dehalococcoidia bacterium]